MASTAEIRTRLLARCDGVDAMRSHRAVRTGLYAATQAVRAEPLRDDPRAWLDAVLIALAAVRASFVDPRDDERQTREEERALDDHDARTSSNDATRKCAPAKRRYRQLAAGNARIQTPVNTT